MKIRFIILFLYLVNQGIGQNKRPNILWITCEDISPVLSMFEDSTAHTPHLDALAAKATIYRNAFAVTGVCGPSRSSIITGMYPTTIGTMHMRTGKDVFSFGTQKYKDKIETVDLINQNIREYSAVIPQDVRCFTDYLRKAGYYCTNDYKTDYQFAAPLSAWDLNSQGASWRSRKPGQPFFSVININHTHESKMFPGENDFPVTIDKHKIPIPPYLTDSDSMRWSIAKHYSNVKLMDTEVGEIIQKLKSDGLYDETIIFFFSDHGGPLPRQKREAYDSGLKVPLIIKFARQSSQNYNQELVSLADMGPTVLSMAGIRPPKYVDGQAIAGKFSSKKRKYIYGCGDRFDEHTDRVRIIRDERYLYVKNYVPNKSGYKNVKYRLSIPGMKEMLQSYKDGKLNKDQSKWFDIKPEEELYDVINDPHQLKNLAEDKKYIKTIKSMRLTLEKQLKKAGDLGAIPESELIQRMWPNNIQPITPEAEINSSLSDIITASSKMPGTTIVYKVTDCGSEKLNNENWQIYTKPIQRQEGKCYVFINERIGYRRSEMVWLK